jgi:hypothetical protein
MPYHFSCLYVQSVAGLQRLLVGITSDERKAKIYVIGGLFSYITRERRTDWRDIVASFVSTLKKFVAAVPDIPVVIQLPWLEERNSLFRTQLKEVHVWPFFISLLCT